MRTTFVLLAALLPLLIAASPVAAHHGSGSHAGGRDSDDGPNGAKSEQRGGFSACDWQSNPGSCPGNAGWAHWCKQQHGPGPARGQCVPTHSRPQGRNTAGPASLPGAATATTTTTTAITTTTT